MDEAGIPALVEAIRNLHGCEATWIETVPVREMHEGAVVWNGEVEVFSLTGHPKATRCYAWSVRIGDTARRRFVAVLHHAPVDSPIAAVRASIVADARRVRD